MSGLRAEILHEIPRVAVDLRVDDNRTLAILGPNGAGKSTVMSIIAGLRESPDSRVRYRDRVLQDRTSRTPPHRRSVVLMSQHTRLFPHMTVGENVAFGPRSARVPRAETARRVGRWLSAAGVADLVDRSPAHLSGGQTQRVALARALAVESDVLLLDEPFSALDVTVAQEIRTLMRSLLDRRSGPTVIVTHDLVDAVTLADEVLVVQDGQATDHGPTREVLTSPTSAFAAAIAGLNLFAGTIGDGAEIVDGSGNRVVGTASEPLISGARGAAVFSPRAVAVYPQAPQGSPRTVLPAVVADIGPQGDHALIRTEVAGASVAAEVTWPAVADLALTPGTRVELVVKASEVRVYAVPSGS